MKALLKFNSIASATLILSSLIYLPGCKKMEASVESQVSNSTSKFFALPAGASVGIRKTAEEFKRQNAINEFIPTLINQSGYPVW